MRTLILTCNTGEGHNACARAIKAVYDRNGEKCDIVDSISFISEMTEEIIAAAHVFMYRHVPSLFRVGYDYLEKRPEKFDEKTFLYRFFALASDKLYDYITSGGYESIICTHVLAALVLTDIMKKYPMNIRTSLIATDYTLSPSGSQSEMDCYFLPDSSLADEFESEGVARDKFVTSGIPIRRMFYEHFDKATAKREFGIDENRKHLIVMGGSMGCSPILKVAELVAEQVTDCDISIVCGTNKSLYKKLVKKYDGYRNVHVRGFVENVSMLMDASELILTKPGGISTTEAIHKRLPLVLLDVVGGCETHNSRFCVAKGIAEEGATVEETAQKCILLMADDKRRREMSENMEAMFIGDSAEIIHETMKKLNGERLLEMIRCS